jgi:hypothetical protein
MFPGRRESDLKIGVESLGNSLKREAPLDASPDVCARGAGAVQPPFAIVENYYTTLMNGNYRFRIDLYVRFVDAVFHNKNLPSANFKSLFQDRRTRPNAKP